MQYKQPRLTMKHIEYENTRQKQTLTNVELLRQMHIVQKKTGIV